MSADLLEHAACHESHLSAAVPATRLGARPSGMGEAARRHPFIKWRSLSLVFDRLERRHHSIAQELEPGPCPVFADFDRVRALFQPFGVSWLHLRHRPATCKWFSGLSGGDLAMLKGAGMVWRVKPRLDRIKASH